MTYRPFSEVPKILLAENSPIIPSSSSWPHGLHELTGLPPTPPPSAAQSHRSRGALSGSRRASEGRRGRRPLRPGYPFFAQRMFDSKGFHQQTWWALVMKMHILIMLINISTMLILCWLYPFLSPTNMDVTWYNYEISWESSGEEWWIMALIMDTFFRDILWDLSYDNQTWLAGKSPIYRWSSSHEPIFIEFYRY